MALSSISAFCLFTFVATLALLPGRATHVNKAVLELLWQQRHNSTDLPRDLQMVRKCY